MGIDTLLARFGGKLGSVFGRSAGNVTARTVEDMGADLVARRGMLEAQHAAGNLSDDALAAASAKITKQQVRLATSGSAESLTSRHWGKALLGTALAGSMSFWGITNIVDFVASVGGLSQGEMKNVGPTGERSVYEMVAEREEAFDFLKTNLSLGDVKVIGFDGVKADTEGAITWDQFQSMALNEFIQNGVTNSARKDAPGMIENYFKQVYSIPDDKSINEWQSWITKKRVDQLMNNLQSDDARNLFTRVEDQLRAGGLDIPAGTLTSTDIATRMMFANDIFSGPAKSNDHLIVRGILARQAGITVEDVATIDPAKYMEALAGQQSSQVNMELNRQGAEFRKRGTDYLYGPGGP